MARLFLLIGLLLGVSGAKPVHAAVNQFVAAPILPADNAAGKGYFDLQLTNSPRKLQLRLANQAATAQTLVVTPTNAVTSGAGMIVYNQGLAKTGPKHPGFGDLLTEPKAKRVRVAAGASAVVTYTLKRPPRQAQGLILGAFAVTSASAKQAGQKKGGLVNLAQYLIGVSLHAGTTQPSPDLKLAKVRYVDRQSRPALQARIQNDEPALIGKVRVVARVYRGSRRVQTVRLSGLNFAPSNRFWLALVLNEKRPLLAGHYRLVMTVRGDNGHWRLTRGFTVSASAGGRAIATRLRLNWRQLLWWLVNAVAVLILFAGPLALATQAPDQVMLRHLMAK